MKIISIANQKGGCGKSTIAINLGINMASKGKNVIIYDTDPQASTFDTIQVRGSDSVKCLPALSDIHLKVHKTPCDVAIIDTPPHDDVTMALAVICSDLVLIPVQDSPMDIRSAKKTVDLVQEAKRKNKALQVRFILSRIQPHTILARELAGHLKGIYKVNALKASTANRVAYKQSMIYGQSTPEIDKRGTASKEVEALTAEVMHLLRIKPNKD